MRAFRPGDRRDRAGECVSHSRFAGCEQFFERVNDENRGISFHGSIKQITKTLGRARQDFLLLGQP